MKRKQAKSKVLTVIVIALFADMLMYGLIVPFLPVHAKLLGASQTEIGILFASYAIALFVATPLFGALADRIGRKKMLIFGLFALVVTTLVFTFASSFGVLVLARLLQGFAAAIPWTAGLALLAEVFPPKERGKAMGLAMSGQAAGVLLGPPAGGWLFELGGYRLPFLIASGIALLAAILAIIFFQNVQETRTENLASPFQILRHKPIFIIAGTAAVGASAIASLEPTLPLHLNHTFNVSPGVIGLMFAVTTLSYGLFAPVIGSLSTRAGHEKTIMTGLVMAAVALPLNALPTHIWLQILTLALLGVSLGMILTPALPRLAEVSESTGTFSQGTTFAVYNTAYSFGMMAGPLIASTLADSLGLITAYSVLGIFFILYCLPLRQARRRPGT